MTLLVCIIGICIIGEGFFSGSELALVSCDKLRLEQRAAQGVYGARLAAMLLKNPAQLFGTTLLGTNLCTITASTIATLALIERYGHAYASFALLLAPIMLVFGEVLPKSIYRHHADWLVDRLAPLLMIFRNIFYPAIFGMTHLTNRWLADVRKLAVEPRITRDELALLLEGDAAKGGDIRASERTMITRILQFAERRAKHVMVSLADIECLPLAATREAALSIFDLKGYAHLPVFANRIFNVVGILEAVDTLCAPPNETVSALMHKPVFVPQEMPLTELFRMLRERHERAAVVVDEYGAAVGIIALEDVCEEVVGEIRDEFSLNDELYQPLDRERFVLNGRMPVETAQQLFNIEVPNGDFKTVAGMLLTACGHIPRVGEEVHIGAFGYRVREANERSVIAVEVWRNGNPQLAKK